MASDPNALSEFDQDFLAFFIHERAGPELMDGDEVAGLA
jgi:hypothetical protein